MRNAVIMCLSLFFVLSLQGLTDQDIIQNKFNLEEIKVLLGNKPEYLNKNIERGNTLLMYALDAKQYDTVYYLLDSLNAEINITSDDFITPLMYACLYGDLELFEHFIDKGAKLGNPKDKNNPIFNYTAIGNNTQIADYLIRQGFEINFCSNSGWYPLHRAIWSQKKEMTEFLLSKGANINLKLSNQYQASPLTLAITKKDTVITKLLIDYKVELNSTQNEEILPLIRAIDQNDYEMVKLLLNNGAEINQANNDWNRLALHHAALRNSRILQLLISFKPDPKQLNLDGENPVFSALFADSTDCLKVLIQAGFELNLKNILGKTPLITATLYGRTDAVKILLENKVDLNITDNNGDQALHYAAIRGYGQIAKLLIEAGAELNKKDRKGYTPYRYAIKYGNKNIEDLIKKTDINQEKFKTVSAEELFSHTPKKNEYFISHLGNSGWIIKTPAHLLIFDYVPSTPLPDKSSLDNGYINTDLFKNQNVIVFVSHEHQDHFNRVITEWQNTYPEIKFYFGFDPNADQVFTRNPFTLPRYTRLMPDSLYNFDTYQISTFKSPIDNGSGFFINIDGLQILHPGDAVYQHSDWPNAYSQAIDKIAKKLNGIDIAFLPVIGCGFHDLTALSLSNEYLMNSFKPKVLVPMHGTGREHKYYEFKEKYQTRVEKGKIIIADNPGDHFIIKQK